MTRQFQMITVMVVAIVAASSVAAVAQHAPTARGPARSIEGAWFGTASFPGLPPTPSMDTFTSNSDTPHEEGSLLCTIAPLRLPNPTNPAGWLTSTASAQGNWLRVGRNEFAYTAWRIMVDQDGVPVGRARFAGTITPLSDEEYSGTMTVEFFRFDGTPLLPMVFAGTLSSKRIEVVRQ